MSVSVNTLMAGINVTLPQPQPNSAALLGDSITNGNLTVSGNDTYVATRGYFTWANYFLGQRFKFVGTYGTGGFTSAQILATHLPQILALNPRPGYVFDLSGSNDVIAGTLPTLAALKATKLAIWDSLINGGITVIAGTVLGRADCNTASELLLRNDINRWTRDLCQTKRGMILLDLEKPYVDETGAILTNYSYDTIHPANLGCFALGKLGFNTLDSVIPKTSTSLANNDDAGNLVTNGRFTGSAGANSGGGSGTVATSWTNNTTGTSTTSVASKVVRTDVTDPGSWQQLAVTGGTGLSAGQLQQQIVTGWAVGDTVVVECDMELAITSGCYGAEVMLTAFGGAGGNSGAFHSVDTTVSLPAGTHSGKQRSYPWVIPVGATSLYCYVKCYCMASGVASMRVDRAKLIKVT